MVYLIILILLIFGSLAYDFKEQPLSSNNKYYLCVIGLMLLVACLAFNLGEDTEGYSLDWQMWPKLSKLDISYHLTSNFSRFQPGWVIIQSLFRSFFDNFIFFQIFHHLFVGLVVYSFIRSHTNNVFFATLMFFLVNYLEFNFEIMRESLAVASSLIAVESFEKKKYLWMVFFSLVAYSFHVSAVVVPLILILSEIKVTKLGECICIILCLVFPIIIFFLFDNFGLAIFSLLSDGEHLEDLYALEESHMNVFGFGVKVIQFLFLPILATFFIKDKKRKKYIYLAYLYSLLRMSSVFSYGLYRLGNYCSIFYFLTVANLISDLITHNKMKKPILVIITVFILMWVFDSYLLEYDTEHSHYLYTRYFPYEWVLAPGNSY